MSIPTASVPEQVRVAHCLVDAQGRVLSARDEDRPLYAASTIKLHVLHAALGAVADGALDLDHAVPATRAFTGADGAPFTLTGDHLDPSHPADGTPVPMGDLLRRMIDRSSNEATDHVLELLGLDAVAEAIRALGLRSTRVERLIGDGAALAAGATNETSAADLAATLRALVVDHPHPLALDALRAQRIPVIGTVLRDGVEWGSKSGWVDGYRHDVAYVGAPGSEELQVLAVMTAGLGEDEADARIQGLARELLPGAAA
ncbi:serine hydrolase [Brachybacterium sp. AOP43-C2-M15]|uniref:serine hydrolase n=1 Tax=Brachybacterium sp. AOP43-C2-M15 TaxID=3457661 RepID=UPI004034EC54